MPLIKWDKVGEKTYESGLDRGVLYLPDGSAVPWNGMTSVAEKFDKSVEPVYFDGAKVVDIVSLGSFSATLSSITYPDALDVIEGTTEIRNGVFLGEQANSSFGLCYRTRVGNDVDGDEAGYKIHVVYNVTAIPTDRTYASSGDDPSLVEFEWDLVATPEYLDGFRPSAHLIIKTAELDPFLLRDIEKVLYGNSAVNASLVSMNELVTMINEWFRIKITDNGDGTWTATSKYSDYIFFLLDGEFRIDSANAIYIDDYTYILTDTKDIKDIVPVKIIDNGDGTWTASSSNPDSIVITGDTFEVREVFTLELTPDSYLLSDQPLE